MLSNLKPTLDGIGARLVGIGTDYGAKEFAEGGYWSGDFLISPDHEIYKRIKGIKSYALGGLTQLFSSHAKESFASYSKLKEELGEEEYNKIKNNYKGTDPFMGATFVIGPGNVLHYSHFQTYAGDHPSNDDVLAAAKAAVARRDGGQASSAN